MTQNPSLLVGGRSPQKSFREENVTPLILQEKGATTHHWPALKEKSLSATSKRRLFTDGDSWAISHTLAVAMTWISKEVRGLETWNCPTRQSTHCSALPSAHYFSRQNARRPFKRCFGYVLEIVGLCLLLFLPIVSLIFFPFLLFSLETQRRMELLGTHFPHRAGSVSVLSTFIYLQLYESQNQPALGPLF